MDTINSRPCVGVAARLAAAAVAAIVTVALPMSAKAACGPNSIGVSRQIEVDAKTGPRFGQMQYPGRDILQDGEIVLTFDDGPHKEYTRRILDQLDAHCTKATFFMVGQRILTYPDIAREVIARGHNAGTHTWSHQNLAKIEAGVARSEIELAISGLQKVVGANSSPFFRFPYLSDPKAMTAHLKSRDTAIFSIDVDSHDFRTRSPTKMMSNVMKGLAAKHKGIILFHDIQPSTVAGIGQLLSDLKAKGYRVVHLVPKQSQTTVAEFDKRIDNDFTGRKFAAAKIPVSQRSAVAPAWEVSVTPPGTAPPASTAGYPSGQPPAAVQAQAPPPPGAAPPKPLRPMREDYDWRGSIFRGW